jgi:hypothetical protein
MDFKVYKDPYATKEKILLGLKGESYIDHDWDTLRPSVSVSTLTTCPGCLEPSNTHPRGQVFPYHNYRILCTGELFHSPFVEVPL